MQLYRILAEVYCILDIAVFLCVWIFYISFSDKDGWICRYCSVNKITTVSDSDTRENQRLIFDGLSGIIINEYYSRCQNDSECKLCPAIKKKFYLTV